MPTATISMITWLKVDALASSVEQLLDSLTVPVNLDLTFQATKPQENRFHYYINDKWQEIDEYKDSEVFLTNQISGHPKIKNINYNFTNRNQGVGITRHNILKGVDTKYLVFLDDDIFISQGQVSEMINYMEENPSYDALSTRITTPGFWVKTGKYYNPEPLRTWDDNIEEVGYTPLGASIMKSNLPSRGINYDKNYFLNKEDHDLCQQIINKGHKVGMIRDISPDRPTEYQHPSVDSLAKIYVKKRYDPKYVKESLEYFQEKWFPLNPNFIQRRIIDFSQKRKEYMNQYE